MSEKEGVVKYSISFTEEGLTCEDQFTELEEVRSRLFDLGLIGAYEDGLGYGNLSVRVEESAFLISATQTGHLESLSLDQYAWVESVDFETFKTCAKGLSHPSSESITHAAIYALDDSINAVIHIHNEKLWSFMLENGFLSTNDTPYGTKEMVNDVFDIYSELDALKNNLFVMKGHFEGIVSFGRDLQEAEKAILNLIRRLL